MEDTALQTKSSDVKISQALELLNEAARDKKDEFKDLLTDKYAHIKKALTDGSQSGKEVIEKAQQFAREGKEKVKETALEVEKNVRENPWPYIGGTALVSIFIGFLMGSARK